MTAAERIKNEIAGSFDKERFISLVCAKVRHYGEADFICDYHVGTNFENCMPTIHVRDKQTAIDIAKAEGFRVHRDSNKYGVKYLVFTL